MNLKFEIQGLGKINSLSLDIKPITVIAGENSSGKTFATKSIYCVLETLNQNQLLGAFRQQAAIFLNSIQQHPALLADELSEAREAYFNSLEEDFVVIVQQIDDCLAGLSLLEHSKLEDLLHKQKSAILSLNQQLDKYLTTETDDYRALEIQTAKDSLSKIIEILNNSEDAVSKYIAKTLADNFKMNYQVTKLSQLINSNDIQQAEIIIDKIGGLVFSNEEQLTFNFATTGIDAIQKINDVVFIDSPVYLRIRQGLQKRPLGLFRSKLTSRHLKGYPEYIDLLYDYLDRMHMDEPEEAFLKLSQKLQDALAGKLVVNKTGEINFYDEIGNPTPLSLAATGVSNLGLIDLLIRNNVIKKGSFLIIDEPEAHIHPKWQVLLMEVLYEMAAAGVNVILATHSLDMLKKLDLLAKNNDNAEEFISVHKMPSSKLQKNATIFEKIEEVLTDLSTPYYEMYLEDNNLTD